jgi:hypothetical protein
MADRICPRCNAKAESDRWAYCPFCGTRYEGAPPALALGLSIDRDKYERVSWEKIRLDSDKFNHRCVSFEARFEGIQHHFAPVERLGITSRNYVNFSCAGNLTNYVKQTDMRLVERLKRLTPFATVTIFAQITILRNPGGKDVIVVLVDDIDV